MTTAAMTTTTATAAGTKARFTDIVRSFWKMMKYRNHQRRSVLHLRAMPDHTLRDLGIHRSEINSVVYGRGSGVRYYEF